MDSEIRIGKADPDIFSQECAEDQPERGGGYIGIHQADQSKILVDNFVNVRLLNNKRTVHRHGIMINGSFSSSQKRYHRNNEV
jgi:hypothetical protein